MGFEVRTLPQEALTDFLSDPRRFDAVVTDMTMPSMSGVDLARNLLEILPDLPVFIATGFSGDVTSDSARALEILDVVHKPIDWPLLAARLTESIETSRPHGSLP